MPHNESFYQAHDGQKLYLQSWTPETEPKAAVLIIHGLAEHSGRYAHFAAELNRAGYAVYTFDGRGHGKSSLPEPTAYFSNMDDYVMDVEGIFQKMKASVGNIPLFLFGHSMGGGITTYYALKYRPDVRGIVLSGAALIPGEDISPLLIRMSAVLSALMPKFKVVKLDEVKLSRDPEVLTKHRADDLIYKQKVPARTGAELLRILRYIHPRMPDFTYSVLIMHGTADVLTNVDGSKLLYERAGSKDKTLKLYEGFYHEIVNELGKEQVMSDIIEWLDIRL